MRSTAQSLATEGPLAPPRLLVGLIAFSTLVDLFATQAVLPSLVKVYGVSPAVMGVAVNAGTLGMAVCSLAVSLFAARIDRRAGVWICLALLAIPTFLLASAPDIATFALLRVLQGVFMAGAFALTMTWLGEHLSPEATQRALAAYITGVVASNVLGRMLAASITDVAGVAASFYMLAVLNLVGAALVLATLRGMAMPMIAARPASAIAALRSHFANPALRAAFGIGFLILFVFVGTFTYVNFVLAGAPIGLSSMTLGLAYLVFLPSLVTTPAAGSVAAWIGPSRAILVGLALASTGLPLLLVPSVWCVLAGMTFIGVGTFFAQAVATGFVGRAAMTERAAASGLYLASYYLGGLAGAVILGQCFAVFGWAATVAGLGVGLAIAAVLAPRLALSGAGERRVPGVSTPHCHPNPERVR